MIFFLIFVKEKLDFWTKYSNIWSSTVRNITLMSLETSPKYKEIPNVFFVWFIIYSKGIPVFSFEETKCFGIFSRDCHRSSSEDFSRNFFKYFFENFIGNSWKKNVPEIPSEILPRLLKTKSTFTLEFVLAIPMEISSRTPQELSYEFLSEFFQNTLQ